MNCLLLKTATLCLCFVVLPVFSSKSGKKSPKKETFDTTFTDFGGDFKDDFMKDDLVDLKSDPDLSSLGSSQTSGKLGSPPIHDKMIKSSNPARGFTNKFQHPLDYGRETESHSRYKNPKASKPFHHNGMTIHRPGLPKMKIPQEMWLESDGLERFKDFRKNREKYDRDRFKIDYFGGKRPFKGIRDNYFGSSRLHRKPYKTPKYKSKYSRHYHHYYPHHPGYFHHEIYHYYHSLPPWYLHLLMLLEQLYRRYGDLDPYFDPYFFWPIWNRPYSASYGHGSPSGYTVGGIHTNYPSYDYYKRSKKLKMG